MPMHVICSSRWELLWIVPNCDRQMFCKWHITLKCMHLNSIIPRMTSLRTARSALPLSPSSSTFRARRCKNLQGLYQLMWFLLHVRLVRFNEGVCPEHIVLYMVRLVGLPFWHWVLWRWLWKVRIIKNGDDYLYISACVFSTKEAI